METFGHHYRKKNCMKFIATVILVLFGLISSQGAQVFPATTNRFNTFFSSNTFNKNLYLTNVGTIDTSLGYSGTGTASRGAPRIFIGEKANSGDDSAINVGRQIQGTDLFSHAFRDESTFISTNTGAYCSFDSQPTITGSIAYNHANGFQSRMNYTGSGVLGSAWGYTYQLAANGKVGGSTAFRVFAPAGPGPITNFYGVVVDDIDPTNIVGDHYAFYSSGRSPSYFGGNLGIRSNLTVTGTASATAGLSSPGSVSAGTYFISGGYLMSAANGIYNSITTKAQISVGTATASGALPWIISSGNAATYTNSYIALNVDGVRQITVTNTGVKIGGTISATNGEVMYQLPWIPTNAIPPSSATITNYVHINLTNVGPCWIATNIAASGSFLILTPTTTLTVGP